MLFSCNSDKSQSPNVMALAVTLAPVIADETKPNIYSTWDTEPYQLKLNMHQLKNELYDLEVSMLLNNDSYYVSPNAKRDFKGKFTIQIDVSNSLEQISKLEETPLSEEEYDPHPFVNGYVNWVRENTSYKLKLLRSGDTDFQVKGFIQFTIEPRCTLEKIPFFIKFEEGKMRVEIDRC